MKTFQQCKDRVLEINLGLTWDDWMLHHDLPKGRFVIEYEQQAADMYADRFKEFEPEPTYKPLSELHKDEEACRKVFEFIVGGDVEFGEVRHSNDNNFTVLYEFKPAYYDHAEPMHEIIILKNASICWMKGEMVINDYNIFELVDFIRQLGYEAAPTHNHQTHP